MCATVRAGIVLSILAAMLLVPACGSKDPVNPDPNPNPTPAIPTVGLVAAYLFNGDALDASGNDNNATLLGDASVGKFLTLGQNATDRLSIPYTVMEGLGNFTISVWLRITTLHGGSLIHTFFSAARSGQDNAVLLCYHPNNDQWEYQVAPSNLLFDDGAIEGMDWHHLAFVRNGDMATLYVDKRHIAQQKITEAAINVDPGGVLLGQDQDSVGGSFDAGQCWSGDVDNLRIYNRALSESEIQILYGESHGE